MTDFANSLAFQTELTSFISFSNALADAGRTVLEEYQKANIRVNQKPDRSFVTEADRAIEKRLRSLITDRYPSHGIIGEEEGSVSEDAEFVWILDPIDGTVPFMAGIPVYGQLIALMHDGAPVLGIIDQSVTDQRWVGASGRQTTLNDVSCSTRRCTDLSTALVTSSNPDLFSEAEMPALAALRATTAWRLYGASCLSYGLLSSGSTDVAIDTGLKLHDFAPFHPIISGAGGVITDWNGRELTINSGPQVLAVGDPERHSEVLRLVQSFLQANEHTQL